MNKLEEQIEDVISSIGEETWVFDSKRFREYVFTYGCLCCEWINIKPDEESNLVKQFMLDKAEAYLGHIQFIRRLRPQARIICKDFDCSEDVVINEVRKAYGGGVPVSNYKIWLDNQ